MPHKGLAAWIPALSVLREYRLGWLRNDIVAGIVLSTMLVPVGIAYAVASGVPAIYGLYATIIPLIAYAIFGPSRILVLGPDSSLAPIILGVVLPLSAADPARAVAIASAMSASLGGMLTPYHRPALMSALGGKLPSGPVSEYNQTPMI